MPHGGYDDEYDSGGPSKTKSRKSRGNDDKYGSSRHRRGSDADSRDRGKGMEVARRSKPKKYSDSEDEEPKKKSKGKSKKKSKKRDASSDEDDDENEVIVTKTAKFKDVDIRDLAGEYLDALTRVFEVRLEKIERWCHDGLIRLDNQTGALDADKLIKQKASEDEKKEWERFEKRYKRMMKEKKEMEGNSRGYGGPSSPRVVYEGRCYQCAMLGTYCGHMGW